MGFSRQGHWSGLPFPSAVHHALSGLSTMPRPSWVALHSMAHGFTELDKAVIHMISLIIFCDCGFHSVCPLRDKDKRLMEASWWERLTVGETGSCSYGQGHVQYIFSPIFCWWVGLCSLPWPEGTWLFDLRPNYGRGNEDNGDFLQKVPCMHRRI